MDFKYSKTTAEVQGSTASSTLSKEKKLTLPSVTRQIFKGMPPHCF